MVIGMFKRSKTRGIVDEKDDAIHSRNIAIGGQFIIIVLLIIALCVFPRFITLSYPPDPTIYTEQRIGTIEKHNVYGFTFMVWQTLNTWKGDSKLYTPSNQLRRMQCFMSDQFYSDMKKLNVSESDQRIGRTRSITTLPDQGYRPEKTVIELGNNTWDVTLDTQLLESRSGTVIKDAVPMRYKFRVIKANTDATCNPWGLLITKMNDKPRRIYFQSKEG